MKTLTIITLAALLCSGCSFLSVKKSATETTVLRLSIGTRQTINSIEARKTGADESFTLSGATIEQTKVATKAIDAATTYAK